MSTGSPGPVARGAALAASALLLTAGPSFAATTLDQRVPALIAAQSVPSVSIATIRKGRIVLSAAYGMQSPGVPATNATLYNLASLTKPLTAEVILRLAAKGLFGLDDRMYSAWTDPDIASDPRARLLTPRLALTHQTGFPNWRDTTGLKFLRDPGTTYGYSGEGYDYVARFAEKKTGKPFETLARTQLFDPAGMRDTSYTGQSWFEGRIALPTDAAGQSLAPLVRAHFSAADLAYATARDYAVFMTGVLRDAGLSAVLKHDRLRIQRSLRQSDCAGAKASSCPLDVGPGLGWQVLVFAHHTILMHTGRDSGVYTFAYLDKTNGDGAVILTNSDNGGKLIVPVLESLGASAAFRDYLRDRVN